MFLMPVAALLGCGAGCALGGRLANFSNLRLRGWSLLALAVAIQGLLGWAPPAIRWQLVILCAAAAAGWCVANRARRGLRLGLLLVGVGVILNAAAIGSNRGMPVSRSALASAGFTSHFDVSRGHLFKHVAMTDRTRLRQLGDDIPLPLPGAPTVLSVGDLLLMLGIVACTATGSLARPGLISTS